jgi:hypothetical protein
MTKPNKLPLPEMVVDVQQELMSGIFIAKHTMNNMDMHRIVVSDYAIQSILKTTKLSLQAQEEAVQGLVDRTPNWETLGVDEDATYAIQIDKIKTILTQETVLEYLIHDGVITKKVDTVEVGIDPEGSVVVEAYYTNLNRESRRKAAKKTTPVQKAAMERAVNILGSNDNLLDLAAKKLEKLKQQGTSFQRKELN